jgi:hypothetical protein
LAIVLQNNNSTRDTDDPYAAIYPRFHFTRLIPEPRADDNSTQDSSDTPLWSDVMAYAELVLRAICEGYIDSVKTAEDVCEYYQLDLQSIAHVIQSMADH